MTIFFKGKAFIDDAKLEHQEKRINKIIAWTKNNVKYKGYINHIYFGYI